MSKQELKQRETHVSSDDGKFGKQLEQTFTVDDNCLPSPKELADYKAIDPRIVDFLIDASVAEQKHRHEVDFKKIELVNRSDKRVSWMNWWGMCFAFLSIIVFILLTGWALYLDKQWFAGLSGFACMTTIVSIFVIKDGSKKQG